VLGVGFRSGPSLGMAVLRTDHPVEPRWRGRLNRAVNGLTAVAAADITYQAASALPWAPVRAQSGRS